VDIPIVGVAVVVAVLAAAVHQEIGNDS